MADKSDSLQNENPMKQLNVALGDDMRNADHLALLFIGLRLFLTRFDIIKKSNSKEITLKFGHRFELAINKLHKCCIKLEFHLRVIKPRLFGEPRELLKMIAAINLVYLYSDLEDWASDLEVYKYMLTSKSQALVDKYSVFDHCNKIIASERVANHYFLFLAEHRAVVNITFFVADSPLLKRQLKKVHSFLKETLQELETTFNEIVKSWKTPQVDEQLDELSFNTTAIIELMITLDGNQQLLTTNNILKQYQTRQ